MIISIFSVVRFELSLALAKTKILVKNFQVNLCLCKKIIYINSIMFKNMAFKLNRYCFII